MISTGYLMFTGFSLATLAMNEIDTFLKHDNLMWRVKYAQSDRKEHN